MSSSSSSTSSSAPKGVTPKTSPSYVDLLEEDKPIAGQKFACLSFVSPEDILEQKNHFFFREFLKVWEFNKSVEKYTQFLNFVAFKYGVEFNSLYEDLQAFIKEEKADLANTKIADEYKTFVDNHEEQLDAEFNTKHDFQTSIRGLKVRGVYPTQKEAELRCKLLREVDPNHDVYVGPVGMWMPFHPDAYKTGRVEYMEETLNQLMSEKKTNEEKAKLEFDRRIKDTKQKAMEENKRNAEKSGNKLTQMLTKDGDLVNVALVNESDLYSTQADVQKELFEGENIVTSKNSDHGISDILGRMKTRDGDSVSDSNSKDEKQKED
jgi:hypothetical protein